MKTILLQDDAVLLRRTEFSLLRRDDLRIVLGDTETAPLSDTVARTRPDLVVLGTRSGVGSLPEIPCVTLGSGEQAVEELLAAIGARLGLPQRVVPRQRCRRGADVVRGDETRRGSIRDISRDGMFIVMEDPFEAGERVRVRARRESVVLSGEVERAVFPDRPGLVPGIGIALDAPLDRTGQARLTAGGLSS